MFGIFKRGKKDASAELREAFIQKYEAFNRLLHSNNEVLEIMADLEEKSSGEFLFDNAYIIRSAERLFEGVGSIVENLDAMHGGRYSLLKERLDLIKSEIEGLLESRKLSGDAPLVLPLSLLDMTMSDSAGGKMANLGELRNRCSMPVPEGFVITAAAFRAFMRHNDLYDRLKDMLQDLDLKDLSAVEAAGSRFSALVLQAELPPEILSAVKTALHEIGEGKDVCRSVSVRSSAPSEDGHFSFAGQYATCLNVEPDAVPARYKEVIASLFSSRALYYAVSRGFEDEDMVMASGVMCMVDALAGGVLYTEDPVGLSQGRMIINGAWGLASLVVDGTGKTDRFEVDSESGEVMERSVSDKEFMAVADMHGGVSSVAVSTEDRLKPCLTDEQIGLLCQYGRRLEAHFGRPQDIEWSAGPDGKIYLLQSRPLRVMKAETKKSLPRRITGQNILLESGVIASRGIGSGPVCIVTDETDLSSFPEGGVLVARTTSTRFAAVMDRVSAIVTDVGGTTGHMASIAREYAVPAILDTSTATKILTEGLEVTVDAINCNIYEGRIGELLEYAKSRFEPAKETKLLLRLGQVMKQVVPLNLIDPESPDFLPEHCHTLHDITRFSHEKAMNAMFGLSDTESAEGAATITLKAGIPIDAHMIDVGGGVRDEVENALPQDILSAPYKAFLSGLTAMKWPEPRTADMGGFFGMMAHAASIPEEQLQQTAIRSFALVSASYMNFSIRLGYHFSMVEAFAGENINDNYIRFFFKGGGAARDRRLRRVRLISELLRLLDFRVKVTDDVINASLMKFRRPDIEARLEALGRMTVFTKQLDMAMYNDEITDWYRDEFVRDHLPGFSEITL